MIRIPPERNLKNAAYLPRFPGEYAERGHRAGHLCLQARGHGGGQAHHLPGHSDDCADGVCGHPNNLNGYSEARSILDVSVAQSTREGFHPIENRRIRKENRQLRSIGEKSFNERLSTYGHLKDSIRKSIDPALGDIADEDILASHGWAQMMAVSNSEFSKSQGVYQAMMKLAGFNKTS